MAPIIAQPPTEEQPALRPTLSPSPPTPTEEYPALVPTSPSAPGEAPVADPRFVELADAVRRHESAAGHTAVPKRPADHALYRRLAVIEGNPWA